MSIASQPGKFKSNLLKSRTICPNRVKTNFFQDHCIFGTNLRFLNAIGLFPAKSGINHWNSNFPTKTNSGDPQGPLTLRMHKTKSKLSNHKNSDNSKAIGSSNLKFSQKLPTIGAHHPAKFQPLPPAVQKLLPKRYILNSFQDPGQDSFQDPRLDSFQDSKYLQNTALLICIWKFLSRPYLVPLKSSLLFKTQSSIISRPSI